MSNELPVTETPVKKKKDKVLIGLIITAIIVGLIGWQVNNLEKKTALEKEQKEQYLASLHLASLSILKSTITATEMCEGYSEVWRNAIDRGNNFNSAIRDRADFYELQGKFAELDASKEDIDKIMKNLNNPIEEYKKAHEKLLEIYGIYTQLNSQAKSPSGSLMTFNQKINELQSDFIRATNEYNVLVPEAKK